MRMRHIVICALPALVCFSTLSHKRRDFKKKTLLNTKCVFWFSVQLLSETFLIVRRTVRDMIRNVYRSVCKVAVIVVRLWCNLYFLVGFFEKFSNTKLHEYPSSGSRVVPCGLLSGFQPQAVFTCIFLTDFSKKFQIQNFMKIRPVGAELFHADCSVVSNHRPFSLPQKVCLFFSTLPSRWTYASCHLFTQTTYQVTPQHLSKHLALWLNTRNTRSGRSR